MRNPRTGLTLGPRMRAEDVLVELDPPARARREHELARRDLRQGRDELVAPGHVVDVVLEDPRIRDRRAPLRRDERREVE